jgi:hypothetical protein
LANNRTIFLSTKRNEKTYEQNVFNAEQRETDWIKRTADVFRLRDRVARWNIFKPKILTRVNYGGTCNGRLWYIVILRLFVIPILWPHGIFYDNFVYFSRFGILYQEKSGNPGA